MQHFVFESGGEVGEKHIKCRKFGFIVFEVSVDVLLSPLFRVSMFHVQKHGENLIIAVGNLSSGNPDLRLTEEGFEFLSVAIVVTWLGDCDFIRTQIVFCSGAGRGSWRRWLRSR